MADQTSSERERQSHREQRRREGFTPRYRFVCWQERSAVLTVVYNCAQIKLTDPGYGGTLGKMLLSIPRGDGHDQEQDSEVRRIGAG